MQKEAAESLYLLENYEKAAEIFRKTGDYLRAIECLDNLNQFEKILEVVHQYKHKMQDKDKEIFIRKYASLAL